MKEIMQENEIGKLIKIILIVTVIFGVFYVITVLVSKEKTPTYQSTPTPSVIQYDEIILGDLFEQNENTYYVLIGQRDDQYLNLFNSLLNEYQTKKDSYPVYTVDLGVAFNKKYVSDTSSFEKNNLKVKGTTLIRIENKEIVEHYEASETILNKLKEMIK